MSKVKPNPKPVPTPPTPAPTGKFMVDFLMLAVPPTTVDPGRVFKWSIDGNNESGFPGKTPFSGSAGLGRTPAWVAAVGQRLVVDVVDRDSAGHITGTGSLWYVIGDTAAAVSGSLFNAGGTTRKLESVSPDTIIGCIGYAAS
jgi:hypothetical protein